MADNSVGVISLDLVIKEKLDEQIGKIRQSIDRSFSKPMEQVNASVTKVFEGVVDKANRVADKSAKAFDKFDIPIDPIERWENQLDNTIDKMDSLKSTYDSLQKELGKASDSGRAQKIIKQMSQIDGQMLVYANRIDNINGKIAKSTGIEDTVKKPAEILDKLTDEIREKLGTFEISTDPVERMEQELQNTREQISLTQKKWQELKSELDSLSDEDISLGLGDKLQAEKLKIEKSLLSMQASAENMEYRINEALSGNEISPKGFVRITEGFAEIKQGAVELFARIKDISKSAGKEIGSFLISPLKGVANTIITPFRAAKNGIVKLFSNIKYYLENPLYAIRDAGKKAFNSLKSAGGKAVSALKNKFSGLKGSVDSLNKPFSRLGKSIKSALKSAFLMAGLYAAFRGIKSALSDACEGNEEFSKSLNEIKANLNIAFQPILTAVMPAINAMMSGLAQAAKALATFTSELFGSTYEKSLETVKKVKEVGKEAQKNSTYLASFDEMNVAQDTSSESSSDSSDESGIDYSALDGKGVELPDWAERMKEAIRSGDWNGVGKLLGEWVNAAVGKINWAKIKKTVNGAAKKAAQGFNGLIDGVDWKKLGTAAGEGANTVFGGIYTFMTTFDWSGFGSSIAEFLNSSIKTADWGLIGRTFASKWNAVIDTAYAFVTEFDWSGFGLSIGESVNAWFDEIDFAKAGETLSAAISGILNTAIAFLQTVDWQGIGEKVWTFLKSIDWGGIISKLFELIGSAIGAAVSLLWGFIKDAVFSIRDYFREQIEDCGGNIVEGLFMGIGGALVNLGTWIKEHVFDPFIDGFKKCFGIHSPSTVMDEQGVFIMEGLLGGITSKIATVINKFKNVLKKIKDVFLNIPAWFKKKFQDAWDKVTEVFDLDTVKEHFTNIKDKIVEIFGSLKDALKEPFNLVIDLINNVIDKINSFSIDVPDWVTEITGIETFGFDIPNIPRLATGGLATAPTLAMVGDNPRARTDPEAILPVSKLQEMLDGGRSEESAQLLREILETLKSLDLTVFATVDRKVLFKLIQDMAKQYKRQTGRSAFE